VVTGAIAGAVGAAVSTAIQGVAEGRTPSWQEYRDNMETGALVGGFIGLASPLFLPLGSEIGLSTFLMPGVTTFISGAVVGFFAGVVHRMNGEVPAPITCPTNDQCTPLKATPAPTPTSKDSINLPGQKPQTQNIEYAEESVFAAKDMASRMDMGVESYGVSTPWTLIPAPILPPSILMARLATLRW